MTNDLTNISGSWTIIQRTIRTEYLPWTKAIPTRKWDWEAWIDETADLGMRMGYGATEAEAIADLLEQEEEVN